MKLIERIEAKVKTCFDYLDDRLSVLEERVKIRNTIGD